MGEQHLVKSADDQRSFLWQVSRPAFSQVGFLEEAVDDYFKFLQLATVYKKAFNVPRYDIDLRLQQASLPVPELIEREAKVLSESEDILLAEVIEVDPSYSDPQLKRLGVVLGGTYETHMESQCYGSPIEREFYVESKKGKATARRV